MTTAESDRRVTPRTSCRSGAHRGVQVLPGDHSVTTTERHAHVADEELAAAVDGLDGLGIRAA